MATPPPTLRGHSARGRPAAAERSPCISVLSVASVSMLDYPSLCFPAALVRIHWQDLCDRLTMLYL